LADILEENDISYIKAVEKAKELTQQSKEVGKVAKNNAFAAGLQVDLQNQSLDQELAALDAREKTAQFMDEGLKKTRELADIAAERQRLEAKRITDEERSLTVVTAIVGARQRNLSIAQKLASLQQSTLDLEMQAAKVTKSQDVGRALTPEEEVAIEESFLSRKLAMEDKALSNRLEAIRLDFMLLAKQIEFEQARIKDLKAIHGDTSPSAVDSVSPVSTSKILSEMEDLLKSSAKFNKIIMTGAVDAKRMANALRRAALEEAQRRAHVEALRDAGLDIMANLREQALVNGQIRDLRGEINDLIRDGQGDSIKALEKEAKLTALIAKNRNLAREQARRPYDAAGQALGGGVGAAISGMGDIASLTAQRGIDEERLAGQRTARDNTALEVMDMEARGAPIEEINESRQALADLEQDVRATQDFIFATNQEITRSTLTMLSNSFMAFSDQMKGFGPEGEYIASISAGIGRLVADMTVLRDVIIATMGETALTSFENFKAAWEDLGDNFTAKAQIIGAALGMLANSIGSAASAMMAASNNRVAGIDKEIAAEQKRDGKSKGSIAKLKELEAKKEKIKRKAFETDKKMKLAQAIISTAAGVAQALSLGLPGLIIAPIIAAMGMMQIAAIRSMTYQGGGSDVPAANPTQIKVGDRRTTTDLAKSQGAGGELAYFRGGQGIGGPENFRPAASGMKYRANGGNTAFMVGEQGPEMFVPERPGTIVPSDETSQLGAPINANINITALDADGVEDILMNQRGNIIVC